MYTILVFFFNIYNISVFFEHKTPCLKVKGFYAQSDKIYEKYFIFSF